MTTKNNQNFTRRATALLGAIAASSFLGLPALAGGKLSGENEQAQAPSGTMQSAQCVPMTTQSALPDGGTATPDTNAPGAAQLPNQSDPRAGVTTADSSVNSTANQMGSGSSTTNNQMASGSSTQMMGSGSSMMMGSGSSMSNMSGDRYNSGTSGIYGNILGRGGVTSGGFANQRFASANTPDAIPEINSMASADRGYRDQAYNSNQANATNQSNASGNVLTQGGATTGGDANQQVMAANNGDMSSTANSSKTDSMNDSAMAGNTGSTMNSSGAMSSSTMNRSSRRMMGNQIAQCPPGMMPDRSSTMPGMRQMPGQSNNGSQTQYNSGSQITPRNEQAQPSPGDGSGAR